MTTAIVGQRAGTIILVRNYDLASTGLVEEEFQELDMSISSLE